MICILLSVSHSIGFRSQIQILVVLSLLSKKKKKIPVHLSTPQPLFFHKSSPNLRSNSIPDPNISNQSTENKFHSPRTHHTILALYPNPFHIFFPH